MNRDLIETAVAFCFCAILALVAAFAAGACFVYEAVVWTVCAFALMLAFAGCGVWSAVRWFQAFRSTEE